MLYNVDSVLYMQTYMKEQTRAWIISHIYINTHSHTHYIYPAHLASLALLCVFVGAEVCTHLLMCMCNLPQTGYSA